MKKGFTLIELLVVVLIIGILSAIAFPQYEAAVDKSRFMSFLPMLRSLKDAQERYYMANEQYSLDVDNLDVEVSGKCQKRNYSNMLFCGDDWILDNIGAYDEPVGAVRVVYCPGLAQSESYLTCYNNHVASLGIYYDQYQGNEGTPGKIYCSGSSARGRKLCKVIESSFN